MNGDAVSSGLPFETFAHEFAGFGSGGGGTFVGVVVSFVSDVAAEGVVGEGDAGLDEVVELA